jgi:hypothetical protein
MAHSGSSAPSWGVPNKAVGVSAGASSSAAYPMSSASAANPMDQGDVNMAKQQSNESSFFKRFSMEMINLLFFQLMRPQSPALQLDTCPVLQSPPVKP